ncbi:TIGR04282 family arsenosugar biosynthesis glycosyltransferase [soil metagenome]
MSRSLGPVVVLVFAKAPEPGRVKTRLIPALGPEGAAKLYRAFLKDTVDVVLGLSDIDVRICMAGDLETVPTLNLPLSVEVFSQTGDGLGERMANAFLRAFVDGYGRVIALGTDHPTLPGDYIQMAAHVLEEPLSAVLGPTDDGGYYLIGLNDFVREPFYEMEFSHSGVFEETAQRIEKGPLGLTILPEWFDVDEPPDLGRLRRSIESDASRASHTQSVLADASFQIGSRGGTLGR